ncbi:hypothetical protein L596_004106 [Steinernema carpocapsae]|uniref:Secreted protein n=1 Tax=Steinernema carpocapsae TaxID=34508 RepID=A0A4U8UVS7_STECR|nr:hypothetical protein L596_004106 [Steinernema carpocapsae]
MMTLVAALVPAVTLSVVVDKLDALEAGTRDELLPGRPGLDLAHEVDVEARLAGFGAAEELDVVFGFVTAQIAFAVSHRQRLTGGRRHLRLLQQLLHVVSLAEAFQQHVCLPLELKQQHIHLVHDAVDLGHQRVSLKDLLIALLELVLLLHDDIAGLVADLRLLVVRNVAIFEIHGITSRNLKRLLHAKHNHFNHKRRTHHKKALESHGETVHDVHDRTTTAEIAAERLQRHKSERNKRFGAVVKSEIAGAPTGERLGDHHRKLEFHSRQAEFKRRKRRKFGSVFCRGRRWKATSLLQFPSLRSLHILPLVLLYSKGDSIANSQYTSSAPQSPAIFWRGRNLKNRAFCDRVLRTYIPTTT